MGFESVGIGSNQIRCAFQLDNNRTALVSKLKQFFTQWLFTHTGKSELASQPAGQTALQIDRQTEIEISFATYSVCVLHISSCNTAKKRRFD